MESRDAFEHLEHMHHAGRSGCFAQRAAVIVAILAALLAISTLLSEREAERIVLAQTQASDAYNEYQGNSLKVHINEDSAATLRITTAGTPQAEAAETQARSLENADNSKYIPNKAVLLAKARNLEAERDMSEHHRKVLQLAQGAFQLGIVLTSVALLSQTLLLVLAGGGLGLIGLALLATSNTSLLDGLLH